MAANDSVEFDYIPGYTKPTHEYGTSFGDEFHAEAVQELLLSTAGYTQRGVTLAGGQGLLPTGCVLGRNSSTGKYGVYNTGSYSIAVGVLRDARDTGGTGSPSGKVSTDCLGNVVIRGILNANLVSGGDSASLVSTGLTGGGIGSGTTGAMTVLGARIVQMGGGNLGLMDGGNAGATGNVNAFIF